MNNILQYFFQNSLDQKISLWFLSFRSDLGIKIFNFISFFGNWEILLPLTFLILFILYFRKKKEFIVPFLSTIVSAEAVTFFAKIFFQRGRPLLAVFYETDFSFPSGHATIAVAFYGYLTYTIIKSVKEIYKWPLIISAIIIIGLIGFSRLYLGVHYLSDVLAGYLVGSIALVMTINFVKISPLKLRK